MNGGGGVDGTKQRFFVSYAEADERWAKWVAWTLEAAGHDALIEAWDFGPGSHLVAELQKALDGSRRTVAVLSMAYLTSAVASEVWQSVWAADPAGTKRLLLPVRIEDCEQPGLLRQLVAVDLFGVDREMAHRRLLDAITHRRGKPVTEPDFPADCAVASSTGASMAELPPNLPALWNVPARLARFTRREELLDALHGQLNYRGTASVCAVHGLGGVGKTALALEYVHRHAGDFDVVWWLPAEDPRLLSGQVAMLGMRLGLRDGVEWPAVATALRDQGRRWLVVLDNVDDPEVISPFRPSDPRGRLLVTSRLTGLDNVGGTVAVNEFTLDEALHLLTGRFPAVDAPLATRIAHLLGCLPLALEQAIAYLAQTGLPAAEYADLLEARLGDMLRRGRVADRPGITIANLWELSMARYGDTIDDWRGRGLGWWRQLRANRHECHRRTARASPARHDYLYQANQSAEHPATSGALRRSCRSTRPDRPQPYRNGHRLRPARPRWGR